jgi:hypothetical protein
MFICLSNFPVLITYNVKKSAVIGEVGKVFMETLGTILETSCES